MPRKALPGAAKTLVLPHSGIPLNRWNVMCNTALKFVEKFGKSIDEIKK
jgi:hypothetical protein